MDRSLSEFDESKVYTVSELTKRIKRLLNSYPGFKDIRVEGEISDFHLHSSGHMYFELKDSDTTLQCVMFNGGSRRVGFEPEDGMQVIAEGHISVYESKGQYQLYVESMEKAGEGELHREFVELKGRLQEEGLFDDSLKKPLPQFPDHVGIVTSDSGAALHDILDVIGRRYPVRLTLAPAKVQGEESKTEIAEALRRIDDIGCDVLIVGRGGGSMRDLWAFNEEVVARAIHELSTPVVSAVGHEVDVTIADFVADKRAATPSEAAELVVPERKDLLDRVDELHRRAESAFEQSIEDRRRSLDTYKRILERRPSVVDEYAQRVDELEGDLDDAVSTSIERKRTRLREKASVLESMSPLKVLSRGYSVVESEGKVVRSVQGVSEGDPISVRVSDGRIKGYVEEVERENDRNE